MTALTLHLQLSPFGWVPVLIDGDIILVGTNGAGSRTGLSLCSDVRTACLVNAHDGI